MCVRVCMCVWSDGREREREREREMANFNLENMKLDMGPADWKLQSNDGDQNLLWVKAFSLTDIEITWKGAQKLFVTWSTLLFFNFRSF